MNPDIGLRVLGQIMGWSDDDARREFPWLKLMARLKYDGYRDFQAGMRFIESLATWLQQFEPAERTAAYGLVRHALVYIGPAEMQRLVEQLYPRTVRNRLVRTIASEHAIAPYLVLADSSARAALMRLRRQTLFMGLSDGSLVDTIRRANSGVLSNEQFVQGTQVDAEKWNDLVAHLRKDLRDTNARFRLAYLVDDFAGTGTSFLRRDKKSAAWKGKLIRFKDSVTKANAERCGDRVFADGWELCVHHYIVSEKAAIGIAERLVEVGDVFPRDGPSRIHASFGMKLPPDLPIDAVPDSHVEFRNLVNKYYDPAIQNQHTKVGDVEHIGLGYGGCALPLILEHNTPNNSVALLWAETEGGVQDGERVPAMRPLFRRRQRHT